MADDISIKDSADAARTVATDEVAGRNYQLVKICFGADGSATAVDGAGNPLPTSIVGTVPVSGPLTDTQLRAVAVPVSGPLTDTQLRATPVPVSGTVTASGPLTDAQLRATAVPISASALPLPAGAATEATLASVVAVEDAASANGASGVVMLAVRQDADTTGVSADGDWSYLKNDEVGRLKVSAQPSRTALVTGSITASAQTVFADVSRCSNVMLHMIATSLVGHNSTFEGSIDSTTGADGNWFGIQAIRSNANTIELVTGVLAATPAYGWECSVNGLSFIRVRATAHTSGTAAWKIQPAPYATEPIPAAQISGTQPVSGTVTATVTGATVVGTVPTASNVNSAATTNATSVKATAGTVYSVTAFNAGAGAAYVKFYNKASAPTVGTDVPIWVVAVPATGSVCFEFGVQGNRFGTGIALAITGAAADSDTTAVAVNQVKVSTAYI